MSHYHLVRICTAGTLTIRNILRQQIADIDDYASMHERINQGRYNYTDSFCNEMRKRGHIAQDLLFDVEKLQKQWARENNLNLVDGELWQKKIILAQLKHLNPDVVFFQGILNITPKDVSQLREELPNLKLIMLHCGFPHGEDALSADTIVFAGTPSIKARFARAGVETHLLYHCFDERLLQETQNAEKQYSASFIGSSGFGYQQGHKTRYWELLKLASNTDIQLWLDEKVDKAEWPQSPFSKHPLQPAFYLPGDNIEQAPNPFCPLSWFLPSERVHAPVYGLAFFQALRDSLVTFHRHTDAVSNEVGAMRLFQATGMGACLMTDRGANLPDLFVPDEDVVVYDSTSEAIEKLNYLVTHPKEAQRIAHNGQQRTLKAHCQQHRAAYVEHVIQSKLKEK